MIEELVGRKSFDPKLYAEKDNKGKQLAIMILANSLLVKSGDYGILKPKEDRKCGDIRLKSRLDGTIINFEIEASGYGRFLLNFDGKYSEVNVPMKNFDAIPDGYFMCVNSGDSLDFVPKRFYMIKVSDIFKSNTKSNVNKYSDGKKEKFYKVPSHLVLRYEWSEKYGTYKLIKSKHHR